MYKRCLFIGSLCYLIFFLPIVTSAHPGRTDGNGGHTCRTNCEKWGLEYGEYHYHNGGGSSSGGGSNSSGSSGSNQSTQTPSPPPEPEVDERQVEADGYYVQAKDFFNNGDYESAIDQLDKIYDLNRNDSKTDSLINESLFGIYEKGFVAYKNKDYKTAKDMMDIIRDYKRTSKSTKQKADTLYQKIENDEMIELKISMVTSAKDEKDYESALSYINELKKIGNPRDFDILYDETINDLTKEAKKTFEMKEYELAKKYYELLIKNTKLASIRAQYQKILAQIKDEMLIQKSFGIDKNTIEKNSLYEHLMIEENETPYSEETVKDLTTLLKEKLTFIFDINIKDLFKGE